jgi:uncharacterized protein (TIGR00266 family)
MRYEIDNAPSYTIVTVYLDEGERIGAEPGAMISRSESVEPETSVGGGSVTGMVKRAISDEQDVVENFFEGTASGGHVTLGAAMPGDIVPVEIGETGPIKVQSGGTVAWVDSVEKSTGLNEGGNLFTSGELTVLALDGTGTAFLSAFGAIHEVAVTPDDPVIVDEDHLLAWSAGLDVSRTTDGGIKSAVLGGEGRVTRLSGTGNVWLQTRDPATFRAQMSPPGQQGGGGGGGQINIE